MGWILTRSGSRLDYDNPDPKAIVFDDVAIALSREGRFGNQCREFLSVAQHSCLVSDLVHGNGGTPLETLIGLLHDAPEAYMRDIPRDLKYALGTFKPMEEKMWRACTIALIGYEVPIPPIVKEADDVALITEARDLMPAGFMEWAVNFPEPDFETVEPWSFKQGYEEFSDRYYELCDLNGIRPWTHLLSA